MIDRVEFIGWIDKQSVYDKMNKFIKENDLSMGHIINVLENMNGNVFEVVLIYFKK